MKRNEKKNCTHEERKFIDVTLIQNHVFFYSSYFGKFHVCLSLVSGTMAHGWSYGYQNDGLDYCMFYMTLCFFICIQHQKMGIINFNQILVDFKCIVPQPRLASIHNMTIVETFPSESKNGMEKIQFQFLCEKDKKHKNLRRQNNSGISVTFEWTVVKPFRNLDILFYS